MGTLSITIEQLREQNDIPEMATPMGFYRSATPSPTQDFHPPTPQSPVSTTRGSFSRQTSGLTVGDSMPMSAPPRGIIEANRYCKWQPS
jgi:hypothetical protein